MCSLLFSQDANAHISLSLLEKTIVIQGPGRMQASHSQLAYWQHWQTSWFWYGLMVFNPLLYYAPLSLERKIIKIWQHLLQRNVTMTKVNLFPLLLLTLPSNIVPLKDKNKENLLSLLKGLEREDKMLPNHRFSFSVLRSGTDTQPRMT